MTTRAERAGAAVLLVTSFSIPHVGGASTHVETLAAALRRRGMLEALVTLSDAAPPRSARYVLTRVLHPDAALAWALELASARLQRAVEDRLSAIHGPAVLHTHDPLATVAAMRAGRGRLPIVQTVHGPWSRENATMHRRPRPRRQAMMESMEREAFGGADLFLAVDRGQADRVVRDFGVERGRIVVIPNAVDVDALPAPADAPSGQPFLLVPRRLVPKNGVEFAIRAFARLPGTGPRLVVAGDGPLRGELERLARQLGVHGRVAFLGDVERPRLLSLMSGATAVLVPSVPVNSIVEATSLAVLEALASRVPVVGSDIGGIAEIMAGGHGALVPPGDVAALAEAIQRVLELPAADRAALVEKGRARVREEFGLDTWMRRTAAAYARALGRRSLAGINA